MSPPANLFHWGYNGTLTHKFLEHIGMMGRAFLPVCNF